VGLIINVVISVVGFTSEVFMILECPKAKTACVHVQYLKELSVKNALEVARSMKTSACTTFSFTSQWRGLRA
jgi:hypothetical protein